MILVFIAAIASICFGKFAVRSASVNLPVKSSPGLVVIEPASAYQKVFEEVGAITYRFAICNKSDHPVSILEITPSCSCVAAEPTSRVVLPYSSVSFGVTYDVHSQHGELASRQIVVKTDSPSDKFLSCELKGYRQKRYEIKPTSINFNEFEYGTKMSSEVTIEAGGEDSHLVFDKAIATSPFITTELLHTESIESGSRHKVRVTLSETTPTGDFEAKVFVPRTQNDRIGPRFWVRAKILGPITSSPRVAFFGLLSCLDAPSAMTVRLMPSVVKNQQKEQLITNVSFDELPTGITAEASPSDPSTIILKVNPAKCPVGVLDKIVVVSCKFNEQHQRLQLPLRGMITE